MGVASRRRGGGGGTDDTGRGTGGGIVRAAAGIEVGKIATGTCAEVVALIADLNLGADAVKLEVFLEVLVVLEKGLPAPTVLMGR